MLMVLSIPAEYKRELQFESRASGKSVSQIVREIFANRFSIKNKNIESLSEKTKYTLNDFFELAKNSPRTGTPEPWTREDLYDNRGL